MLMFISFEIKLHNNKKANLKIFCDFPIIAFISKRSFVLSSSLQFHGERRRGI